MGVAGSIIQGIQIGAAFRKTFLDFVQMLFYMEFGYGSDVLFISNSHIFVNRQYLDFKNITEN